MKKLIGAIVLMAAAAAIGVLLTSWTMKSGLEKKLGYRAELLTAQMQFLRNNSLLRPITDSQGRPDLQKYLMEANTLVNWYWKNPIAELWKTYPEMSDPERLIKEKRHLAEEEGPKQKAAKANLPIWEESYSMVRKIYDKFKSGTYEAVASDFQGSVRMDIVSVSKDSNRLKWEFMLWGSIGAIVYDGWRMRLFKSPSAEERKEYEEELAKAKRQKREPEMKDPATMHFAESASASKHPVLGFVLEGSNFIEDFPPGAQLNYFYTPTCAPDAESVEMVFMMKAHSAAGADQNITFTFRLPVDPSWKGSWDGVQKIEAASEY